jgi:DNA-binding CsgD family transcriptional regulator
VAVRTIVVVHREALVAESIAVALGRFPGILPLAWATTAAEAERLAHRADAVALDRKLFGAEAVAKRLFGRGLRVVLLGSPREGDEGVVVSPSDPVSVLAEALAPGAGRPQVGPAALTARQRQILALAARGLAGKEVARTLGISPKTVERHKTRIFAKLGVSNQTAAVMLALAEGLEGPLERAYDGVLTAL